MHANRLDPKGLNARSAQTTRRAWSLALALVAGLAAGSRAHALGAASKADVKRLTTEVHGHVRAEEYPDALRAARRLAELGGGEAAEALFDLGLKVNVPVFFNGIAEILAGMTDPGAVAFFEKESKGRNGNRLIYLADILSLSRDASAAVVVGSLAESKHPTLVRAAIGALRKIRKRESIPPLLALLESLEKKDRAGLLYQETRDALYDLTGENFESLADWKNWWEPRKESYTPDSAEVGQTRVVRRAREDAPEFVGRQIFASNTIFVIDTSGTMQYVMKNDIPGIARGDGSDSAKIVKEATEELTPENERLARYWTRLEMARRALLRALHGFSPRAVVNVEEFNRVVRLLEKKPARFTGNMKKSLIARVERLSVSLAPGTDTLEALETAMASDKGLAAIYFLSDGLPSADGQKNDDPMPILEKMEVLNRFRKVKIHTFGYDPEWTDAGGQKFADPELTRANEFLQKLAERSGGTFTLLEVTDEEPPESFK